MSELTLHPKGWQAAPYAEQWFGAWAMRELEFVALSGAIRNLDVSLHLDSQAAREAAAKTADDGQFAYSLDDNGVAMIQLRGRMQKQQASLGNAAATVPLRRAVRAAAADPEVGAILMVFDSPGGTVAGTAELAADVAAAAAKKPVIGLIEDLGASACYWVASQCTQLLTQSSALVGSIGTYGVVYDQSAAAAQEGVKVHVIKAGALKGAGVPGSDVTTEQLLDFQREIDALNECFLAGVASGREISIDAARQLATGQVWVGKQAVDNGLADGIASIDQALAVATTASLKTLKPDLKTSKRKEGRNMAAATYQEIVAACPGATAEFICDELKAGASLEQATKDFMAHQQLRIEQQAKENSGLATKLAEAEKKAAAGGNPPLGMREAGAAGKGAGAGDGSAYAEFHAAVNEKIKSGMTRQRAVHMTVRENPGLQQAMLAEANSGPNARRKTG